MLSVAVITAVMLSGCGKGSEETVSDGGAVTSEEASVDGAVLTTGQIDIAGEETDTTIYMYMPIEDFNDLGFEFGDSVDIYFDGVKSLEDMPYYSGYYVPIDELVLVGYPGSPCIKIARNYGSCTWEEFGLTKGSKIEITLNEKGKYAEIQELYSLEYSDNREDFASDAVFANFREVQGGDLKEGMFYRSASPCDNKHNRAPYANRLAEEEGIRFALNMSDDEETYASHTEAEDFESEYYDSLYKDGKVLLLGLKANYRDDGFVQALSKAFAEMSENEGPVLIHCVEGKDRTGFACALLEALADASPQEIIDDYMITYDNLYGISEKESPDRYNAVLENVADFVYYIAGAEKGTPFEELDLKKGAEEYLRRGGLTDEEIQRIEDFTCGAGAEAEKAA